MTTLILGGAGRSGSRIHDRLIRLGVPTRLVSRRTGSLRTFARRAAAAGA